MQDKLIELFQRSVNARSQMAQTLTPSLVSASQTMVGALLEDARVLIWAEPEVAPIGRLMASQLLRNGEFERPPLPALCLNDVSPPPPGLAYNEAGAQPDSDVRSLRALGSPGDVLVLLAPTMDSDQLRGMVDTAHEKGIVVLLCHCGSERGDDNLVQEPDIALAFPAESLPINLDNLLFAVQALCALVDHQLFGSRI